MRKRNILLATVVVALAAAATLVSVADEPVNVVIQGNPGGSCNCPAIYAPVVCKDPDGGRPHYFSSLCVAGCHGYTKCEPWDDTIGG